MKKLLLLVLQVCLFACSSKSGVIGKRISLAKSNITFILPDSSLIYSKPILWAADYSLGDYGEAGGFYHNQDSSVIVSVYIKAYPNPEQRTLQWLTVADEKRQRETLLIKNRGLVVIEQFVADSSGRTVTIDYHMPKQTKKGRRGQASYEKDFTFYGPQRMIRFWFFAPDNKAHRQAIAAACASVYVNPTYLQASVKPYSSGEYQD